MLITGCFINAPYSCSLRYTHFWCLLSGVACLPFNKCSFVDKKCQMSRMSGYDSCSEQKRLESIWVRKVVRDGADATASGRQLHTWGPATENARLPSLERWTGGCTSESAVRAHCVIVAARKLCYIILNIIKIILLSCLQINRTTTMHYNVNCWDKKR